MLYGTKWLVLSVNRDDIWADFSVGAGFPVMELSEKVEREGQLMGMLLGWKY